MTTGLAPAPVRRWRPGRFGMIAASGVAILAVLGGGWAFGGSYALHVLVRHGGTYWANVALDSPRLSPSMRLALAGATAAVPGSVEWRRVADGFEVADLPAIVEGSAADHLLLARIDPVRFRFEALNAPDGDKGLDEWVAQTGAALVVNGSYFGRDGRPDTPFLSNGTPMGPRDYDARAGAFVASPGFAGVRDLGRVGWQAAFEGAANAMVSYPMLVADGAVRVAQPSRWLANRSFVGQDGEGRVVVGTTTDAFFTLDGLARFLLAAPLGLTLALNLDGGPVASQAVSLNGFERRSQGLWEARVENGRAEVMTWPYGTVAMPVVLAVFPR